jgi:hypothetical protein
MVIRAMGPWIINLGARGNPDYRERFGSHQDCSYRRGGDQDYRECIVTTPGPQVQDCSILRGVVVVLQVQKRESQEDYVQGQSDGSDGSDFVRELVQKRNNHFYKTGFYSAVKTSADAHFVFSAFLCFQFSLN